MRLRNLIVLAAIAAMSFGTMACSKKTEEQKPADSMMTPAPTTPAPAVAPTPAPATMDSAKGEQMKKDGEQMKKEGDKMKKEGEKKAK